MPDPIAAAAIAAVSLPLASYVVEALRPQHAVPRRVGWGPEIPVRWIDVHGNSLRYVTAGHGPPLLLLHTLRTQLDMFQKVIPALAGRFRVYAIDFPGHGYSAIRAQEYTPELFVAAAGGFLDALDISGAVVVGESIGGAVGLLLAARQHPRVRGVVAVNPYDYGAGSGLRRSSLIANVLFGLNNVPILGGTFMRLRSLPVERLVFEGGVERRGSFPPGLIREMHRVGNRRGYYGGFMSLVRHWPEWEHARREYGGIRLPVLLLYGDHDWSRQPEREANGQTIPSARLRTVASAGHFLSLDAPDDLVRAVNDFVESLPGGK
jgi:pimeloyl-ACP methyl ester carboxylesterase